jgi:hypothetical protein
MIFSLEQRQLCWFIVDFASRNVIIRYFLISICMINSPLFLFCNLSLALHSARHWYIALLFSSFFFFFEVDILMLIGAITLLLCKHEISLDFQIL